jgi:hypothetical protein
MGLIPNDKVPFVIPQKKPIVLQHTRKISAASADNESPIPMVYPIGDSSIRNCKRDIREIAGSAKFDIR